MFSSPIWGDPKLLVDSSEIPKPNGMVVDLKLDNDKLFIMYEISLSS